VRHASIAFDRSVGRTPPTLKVGPGLIWGWLHCRRLVARAGWPLVGTLGLMRMMLIGLALGFVFTPACESGSERTDADAGGESSADPTAEEIAECRRDVDTWPTTDEIVGVLHSCIRDVPCIAGACEAEPTWPMQCDFSGAELSVEVYYEACES